MSGDAVRSDTDGAIVAVVPFGVDLVVGEATRRALRSLDRKIDVVVDVSGDPTPLVAGDPALVRRIVMTGLLAAANAAAADTPIVVRARIDSSDDALMLELGIDGVPGLGWDGPPLSGLAGPVQDAGGMPMTHANGFTVTLPLRPVPSAPRRLDEGDVAVLNGCRVLMLTGSSAQREVIGPALRELGVVVADVADPVTALARLQTAAAAHEPFDVAVVGPTVNWMAPLTFAQALRKIKAFCRLPLVLVEDPRRPFSREEVGGSEIDLMVTTPADLWHIARAIIEVSALHRPSVGDDAEVAATLAGKDADAMSVVLVPGSAGAGAAIRDMLDSIGVVSEIATADDAGDVRIGNGAHAVIVDAQSEDRLHTAVRSVRRADFVANQWTPVVALSADEAIALAGGADVSVSTRAGAEALREVLLAWTGLRALDISLGPAGTLDA